MRKSELPELSQRLSQLAEVLGGKSPSPAALVVWGDTLAECAVSDVLTVLIDWPKSHAKMPLPAEVLKAAREIASARRERIAEADRSIGKGFDPGALKGSPDSPAYRAFRSALAVLRQRPKPDPKAWAYALKAREEAGENLGAAQRQNWRAALRWRGPVDRVETDDERESRLEREAMQAEDA